MTLYSYWIQTKELTLASVKSRYRKTWAGFIWVIMNPLLMFGVQSLVFKKFLRLDMPNYFLFLLGGLLPWIFFTTTVQMGTPVFVIQAPLLRSFKINPWVILGSQVLDGFINFLASFLLIMLPFYIYSQQPLSSLALLPLALVPLLLGTLGFTIILSVLNVFYRDVNFVMGFVFSLLFFLTPIFYPREYVPMDWQWMIDFNPVIYFIEPFRAILYGQDLAIFGLSLLKGFGIALLSLAVAYFLWKKRQNEFYRRI